MATTLEVCLCAPPQLVDSRSDQAWIAVNANAARGVAGLELRYGEIRQRTSPTSMISTNRDPERLMELFVEKHSIPIESVRSRVEVSTFAVDQYLVLLSRPVRTQPLVRGNRLVSNSEINTAEVQRLQHSLGEFLLNSVHPDGRMTYAYFPSRGEEDTQHNNMIRQFMASFALCQLARTRNDPRVLDIVRRNLRFNLDSFYRTEPSRLAGGEPGTVGELGLIEYQGRIKLGAVALAALTIMVHPDREQYAAVEASLWRTIDFLWRDSGEFRTFYEPAERNDMQNFYPGEALLAWAYRYRETKDPDLERRFMRSFRFYRGYHREPRNRNPAFIPWHTQAYYSMWQQTAAPELADFILEMNDWLLPIQQWPMNRHPEFAGRFYDPKRPFGPPHASSTGVYLEGLADAYALARTLKDLDRAERYRLAICRGIRSLSQLTFRDEVDMFYVHRRARLKGGVRTTCYNNVVRIDNVQHNFLALQKISTLLDSSELSCAPRRTTPTASIAAEDSVAVLETDTLLGANVFANQTAVRARLRLAETVTTHSKNEFAHAVPKLGGVIPALESILDSTRLASPGNSTASVARLVASVAAALQAQAGCTEQAFFAEASESGHALALTTSQYPELGQRALISASALVGSALSDAEVSQASLARQVNSFMSLANGWLPSPERRALASVACARRIPCELVSSNPPVYRLGQGRFQILFNLTTTSHTSAVHAQLTSNKPLANRVFRQLGVPMARQLLAKSAAVPLHDFRILVFQIKGPL